MQIGTGIAMLEISANILGQTTVIHPTLLWDEDTVILVDTGYPGQSPLFREAIHRAGISFEKLGKIIVTHQDIDHIGSLPVILTESPQNVEVLSNEVEKPFIQGDKRLLRMTPEAISQAVNALPAEVPEEMRKAFRAALENPPKANVDRTVVDGEVLQQCGGIVVINTPGHTPGHISLYHQPTKTLIAGDAMTVIDGELLGPDPQTTLDMTTAIQSLNRLTQYEIDAVICYHGGLFRGNVNERITALSS